MASRSNMKQSVWNRPILGTRFPTSAEIQRKINNWTRFAAFAGMIGLVMLVLGWLMEPSGNFSPNAGPFSAVFRMASGGPFGIIGAFSLVAALSAGLNIATYYKPRLEEARKREAEELNVPPILAEDVGANVSPPPVPPPIPAPAQETPAQIYVSREGKSFGPFTPDQVRANVAAGVFQWSDVAWADGHAAWTELRQLLDNLERPQPPLLPTNASTTDDEAGFTITKWRAWELFVLYTLAVFFPISGIVLGGIGLFSQAKRKQAGTLMAVALLLIPVWFIILSVA